MTAAPTTNQRFRVRLESTIGAHTNSNVNASEVAARIAPTRCTGTPALTRLLPRASPMTPRGHAVQACRKKNVKGGLEPEPTGFGARIDGVDMDSPAPLQRTDSCWKRAPTLCGR
jgi:hypothetical protein